MAYSGPNEDRRRKRIFMEQSRKYFPSLTGLKAVMCLVIVCYHTMPETPLINAIPLSALVRYIGGSLGNSVFFMISGFLMVNAYRDRIQGGSVPFGPFLWGRISKFYGIYLLTNFLCMILRGLRYGLSSINVYDVSMILLLQNGGALRGNYPYNGPTWFVSMLLICNLVFYAVCYLGKNRTAYRCALVGVIVWGYLALTHEWALPLVHSLVGVGLVNFFLGCILAEVYPAISDQTHRWLSPFSLLALAGALLLMVKNGVDNGLGSTLPGIAFGLSPVIVYAAVANPLLRVPLSWKPMQAIGKISISVFFWHMVVYEMALQLLGRITGSETMTDLQYLVYLLLMLSASFLSDRYLEHGFFRKKEPHPQTLDKV